MRLYQLKMAQLVHDDSLLHFAAQENNFLHLTNGTFFILDECCRLMLCLHLMEPRWLLRVQHLN